MKHNIARSKDRNGMLQTTSRDDMQPGSRRRPRTTALGLTVVGVTICCAVIAVFSVRASKQANIVAQPLGEKMGRLERQAIQPEAARMRRRLGERFRLAGRELSVLTGTLTINGQQRSARIVRRQQEVGGEEVAIELSGAQQALTWKASEGARLGENPASGTDRELIERVVMDSPDQFILAESRGASYRVVARMVRPAESGDGKDYEGPLWDVVRITEPERFADKIASPARLFHVNVQTGLIERILSKEQGDVIVAELSEWTNLGGELVPLRTAWRRNGDVVMQLSLTTTSYGPRQ